MDESIKEFFHRCIVCQYVICDDYGDSVIGTYLGAMRVISILSKSEPGPNTHD